MTFSASAQARLNEHTHMIYYSSQLIETGHELSMFFATYFRLMIGAHVLIETREVTISEEVHTSETITRMSEVIAAQKLPVSLVVTGEDLSKRFFFVVYILINVYH